MRLSDVLTGFFWLCQSGRIDIEISGISDDSRTIGRGEVFVCIHGAKTDGFDKIKEAIDKGAAAIVASRPKPFLEDVPVTWIQTPDTRYAAAKIAAAFYGYPSKKMIMVGITGTKGKTTTAYMLRRILTEAGYKTGIIGTVEIDNGKESIPSLNTTPGAVSLQKYLFEMVQNGMDAVVMEVSSQGLKQSRTSGITFDAAILTNIYPDHIGKNEHADMEEYIFCKSLLFRQCRIGIVNGDDNTAVCAVSNAPCRLRYYKFSECCKDGSVIYRLSNGEKITVTTNMPGEFNQINALAATAAADVLGIKKDAIISGLQNTYVRGRTEIVPGPWPATVMIDYAHNAAALESLLQNLRKSYDGRLICMFGCGGNRAKSRRVKMGETSGRLADLTVVTTDNPRDEEPWAIIEDIVSGLKETKGKYRVIVDRKEAIQYCLLEGKAGDLVILAGKGHENYQEIKGVKYPFNEKDYLCSLCDFFPFGCKSSSIVLDC